MLHKSFVSVEKSRTKLFIGREAKKFSVLSSKLKKEQNIDSQTMLFFQKQYFEARSINYSCSEAWLNENFPKCQDHPKCSRKKCNTSIF